MLNLKILMVSDLHYSTKLFHGRDESKVFEILCQAVDAEKPDIVLSAGDFGEETTEEMFRQVFKQRYFLTTYGNHDNTSLIKNLGNEDGSPCWLSDGNIREWQGLRIAAVNGNIALRKRKLHHHTIDEVEQLIEAYSTTGRIDILVTHEAPEHPLLKSLGYNVLNKAVEIFRPKIYLCGHIHIPSQIIDINGTLLVSLDSSMKNRNYATVEFDRERFHDIQIKKLSVG